jgi:hypothetical protein
MQEGKLSLAGSDCRSGCPPPIPISLTLHKDHLLMPRAPAGRFRGRRATADRLVCRISHDEPALPRSDINKWGVVMRRWLRDISCGHRVNLPSRGCLKRQRPRCLRDACTSSAISRLVVVFLSSVRTRPAKPEMVARPRVCKGLSPSAGVLSPRHEHLLCTRPAMSLFREQCTSLCTLGNLATPFGQIAPLR